MYVPFPGLRHACVIFVLIATRCESVYNPPSGPDDDGAYYTNEFAARIEGGVDVAREVAVKHGYKLKAQVRRFPILQYQHLAHFNRTYPYMTTTKNKVPS